MIGFVTLNQVADSFDPIYRDMCRPTRYEFDTHSVRFRCVRIVETDSRSTNREDSQDSRTAKRKKGGARRRGKIKRTNREALLFDPGPIARVSGPPRSVGVTQVATPIHLMGTNIIIAASSSLLSIQIN